MLRQIALIACVMSFASVASAQVEQGRFKLGVDTHLFRYFEITEKGEDAGIDYEESETQLVFGPEAASNPFVGHLGLVLGYVAHEHVIPQLRLSFARSSSEREFEAEGDSDSADGPTLGALMLRPELEIPFNPADTVVGYGLVGFDYRRTKLTEESDGGGDDYEIVINGYGPAVGLGLHIFALPQVSVDLGATFSYLVLNVEEDDEENESDLSITQFGITAGLSLWP